MFGKLLQLVRDTRANGVTGAEKIVERRTIAKFAWLLLGLAVVGTTAFGSDWTPPPVRITPPSNAVPLNLNAQGDASLEGSIVTIPTEIDFYAFDTRASGAYKFTLRYTDVSNGGDNFVAAVYDGKGERQGLHFDGLASYSLTLQAGAPYYVGVTTWGERPGGGYRLDVNGPDQPQGGTAPTPTPSTPLTAGTPPSGTQVNLCWLDVTIDEVGFAIYQSANGGAYQLVLTLRANVTCQPVTGLTPGTNYTFAVGAYDSSNNFLNVNYLAVTTPAAPAAPTSPGTLQWRATSGTTIDLFWNNSVGAEGYWVYYWDGTKWQYWTTTATNVTQVSVPPGYTYYLYVWAFNQGGKSYTGTTNVATVPN